MSAKISVDVIDFLVGSVEKNISELEVLGYIPTDFINEMSEFGALTAIANLFDRGVINGKVRVDNGLKMLKDAGKLNLSIEFLILNDKRLHQFFTETQIENARLVLEAYHGKKITLRGG